MKKTILKILLTVVCILGVSTAANAQAILTTSVDMLFMNKSYSPDSYTVTCKSPYLAMPSKFNVQVPGAVDIINNGQRLIMPGYFIVEPFSLYGKSYTIRVESQYSGKSAELLTSGGSNSIKVEIEPNGDISMNLSRN